MIKPTDKLPLTSNFEEMEEMFKQHVNPITGTIYKHKKTDHLNADVERMKERIDPDQIDDLPPDIA